MRPRLSRPEAVLLGAASALAGAAVYAPSALHEPALKVFADDRTVFGIVNGVNVLSCAAFTFAGVIGLWRLARTDARVVPGTHRAMTFLFFAGMALLGIGAATYQLEPNAHGLMVQRACLSAALAGLVGIAASGRLGERASSWWGLCTLSAGVVTALYAVHQTVIAWSLFAVSVPAVIWSILCGTPRNDALPVRWSQLLLGALVAKLLALNDALIFSWTGWVSGQTLSHLAACACAWPVMSALARSERAWQAAEDFSDSLVIQGTSRSRSSHAARPIRAEALDEGGEALFLDRCPDFAHQVEVVVEVMDGSEHWAEHFPTAVQMMEVRARETT